jgi:hypothetical protein
MKHFALAVTLVALPLLAGCASSTTSAPAVDDGGTPADTGAAKDAARPDSAPADTGTPVPTAEDACGAEAKQAGCLTCCTTINANASAAFGNVISTCSCEMGAGKCATECATTECANPPVDPGVGSACDTCIKAGLKGACKPAIDTCKSSGPCKPLFDCFTTQACFSKP